jgi:hypothetical protein
MNIILGYKADPHITAQQLRNTYVGIFGDGVHILDVGSNLAATVISATEVQIADGVMVAQGCTASIENGMSESLVIANGTQGMLRRDLIVAQYTKNSGTGVENMSLAVKTGTPAASDPAAPAYTTGSIADGDTLVEFPLYQVNLDGISITSVDPLVSTVSVLDAITDLQNTVTELQNTVDNTKLTVVNAPLGTMTFNSAGATGGTFNVAQRIPAGYTMIGAIPAQSGYFGAYFYSCTAASATTVYVQLMRISGTQAYTNPIVKLLCVKNL